MSMLTERVPQLRLFMHLTRNCNLRCTYCYASEKVAVDMTREVGETAIDRFCEVSDHLRLQFYGGEPLLMFDLMRELHAYAERRSASSGSRVSYSMITNGTLFDEEVAEFCRSAGVGVTLSIDGGEMGQDSGRVFADGRGSFATVDANLDRMLGLRLFVHVVVDQNNVDHLVDSIRFLFERGVRAIAITPTYALEGFDSCMPALERQIEELAALYVDYRSRGEHVLVDWFDAGTRDLELPPCRFGREDFSVGPDGRIYPCCTFVDLDVLELGDVWKGLDPERCAELQSEVSRLERRIAEEHGDCPEHSLCRKGCGCGNICYGRASDIAPAACRIGALIDKHRKRARAALAEARA